MLVEVRTGLENTCKTNLISEVEHQTTEECEQSGAPALFGNDKIILFGAGMAKSSFDPTRTEGKKA